MQERENLLMMNVQLLERMCELAEKRMLEKSGGERWTSFKDNLCLVHCPDSGWGLVVYDDSNSGEMSWVRSSADKRPLDLGETFIENARTEQNEMLLEAAVGDGFIRLPVLDQAETRLPERALEMILTKMIETGCFVEFTTKDMGLLSIVHAQERKKIYNDVHVLASKFGSQSPQVALAKMNAFMRMNEMTQELESARFIVQVITKPYSCLEELAMNLDLQEGLCIE